MKTLNVVTIVLSSLLIGSLAEAGSVDAQIEALAIRAGYKPSQSVVRAISVAAATYKINPLELAAIAIIETGMGRDSRTRLNRDGSIDKGLFQINTVNYAKCKEYNLDNAEGSALCAAKLLYLLKKTRKDYVGAYHSKTPSKKLIYLQKINKILVAASY